MLRVTFSDAAQEQMRTLAVRYGLGPAEAIETFIALGMSVLHSMEPTDYNGSIRIQCQDIQERILTIRRREDEDRALTIE
jgi:hypothetical protein